MKQVENGDNRHEGSCNGGLMTNYSPINEKALQIAENKQMVDSEIISQMFTNIKNKGILNKPIEVKLTNEKNIDLGLIELMEFKDYIEQFIYYRKLRGYTQSQVGQVIGVSGKTYYKYEKRIHKLNDINKIKKIADFLEIEEIKLPEIKNKITNKELKEYLEENNITNSELSRKTKISRRSIIDWFNKETKISDESYKKINDFILNFEREKAGKKQLDEEEEME